MKAGVMTTGLTNCPTGGDPAIQNHFCASAAVAAETAASGPDVGTNVGTNFGPNAILNQDSWRAEVAARLERYRTRRKPRTPRYPSLLLPFDAPESRSHSASDPKTGSPRVATAQSPAERDVAFEFRQTFDEAPPRTPERTADRTGDWTAERNAHQE